MWTTYGACPPRLCLRPCGAPPPSAYVFCPRWQPYDAVGLTVHPTCEPSSRLSVISIVRVGPFVSIFGRAGNGLRFVGSLGSCWWGPTGRRQPRFRCAGLECTSAGGSTRAQIRAVVSTLDRGVPACLPHPTSTRPHSCCDLQPTGHDGGYHAQVQTEVGPHPQRPGEGVPGRAAGTGVHGIPSHCLDRMGGGGYGACIGVGLESRHPRRGRLQPGQPSRASTDGPQHAAAVKQWDLRWGLGSLPQHAAAAIPPLCPTSSEG